MAEELLTLEEQNLVRKIADRIERRMMHQDSINLSLLIFTDIRAYLTEVQRLRLDRVELEKELRQKVVTLATGMMIIAGKLKVEDLKEEDKNRFEQICQLTLDQILALMPTEEEIRKQGAGEGVQAVIDYLKNEIDTVAERSVGEPKLKAHFNAMEKTILQTVVNALEEWQALKDEK